MRFVVRWGIGLGLAGLSCAGAMMAVVGWQYFRNDRPIVLPKPRGPHPVGRVLFDWNDTHRNRELMVFLWYPAGADSSHTVRAEYVPGKWGDLTSAGVFPIPARRIRDIEVSAIEHAPVLDGTHPLIVLSPGMGRIPTDYTTIAEDLASFGYIVAGVTPTGSARVVVFSDGRVEGGKDGVDLERRVEAQPLVERWVGDFSFVLDQLASNFGSHIDFKRAGVVGHSFGGAAAMQALHLEPRFARGANLDGAPEGNLPLSLNRPVLIISGAPLPPSQQALNDKILGELKSICSTDTAGGRFEDLPQAGHMNFSDAGVFPSRFPIPRSHLDLTNIDGAAFLYKTADILRSFFDQM